MTRRDRLRDLTIAEIKATARQQMAESGTAGVSLSAIARAMELSRRSTATLPAVTTSSRR